ncbi:aromatic ring-hydroxylating oxygenase subunit alpha [Stagnihabitans tardus]|uniref:Rieske 2Fe-2S domain-containing protein n=1 Tax=Stagnihabitans tardus TaxID=2699202 RepID=A0AAE4Y910_9RHOB|nr:aromatic ring-hydroxylating dioxygenase subunit alpha [Stagnihabitans tardus]NBZ88171.1 Rieske 2Fe-2S domain-containing protein [Stagnihabitans tardus]
MTAQLPFPTEATPNDWDRSGLPAWTYHSPAIFDLEREVFLNHWQVVGHASDIPAPGDWLAFDILGERAVVMRGQDGVVRAFHNLCRHRGARVVDGVQGNCRGAVVCPFHGWVYNLDGTLRGAARPESFGALDREKFGLKPIEMECFHGFLFLRFHPGPQPSVAELLAPFAEDFAAYRAAGLLAVGESSWLTELPVNWKSVRDVDNEGYHVALAHPSLQELYGRDYADHQLQGGINFSRGGFGDKPGRRWSVKEYVKLSEDPPGLPDHLKKTWTYYGMFPAIVFAFTPEGAQFYHEIPIGPGQTRLTGRQYRYPEETRRQRLARYLAMRIDRDTSAEDQQLTIWSNESMKSQAFEGFHLSDLEYGLRAHHDRLRALIPVMRLAKAPPESEIARLNAEMLGKLP